MINLIWAQDEKGLIGKDNKMPWHCKEDLLYFKSLTEGKTVLLGYNNYVSLKGYYKDKKLPYGDIYLLTHKDLEIEGINVIHDLKDVLFEKELWVIGGASIYRQMMEYADKLYISIIKGSYDGDIYLNDISLDDFSLESTKETEVAKYLIYKRK